VVVEMDTKVDYIGGFSGSYIALATASPLWPSPPLSFRRHRQHGRPQEIPPLYGRSLVAEMDGGRRNGYHGVRVVRGPRFTYCWIRTNTTVSGCDGA